MLQVTDLRKVYGPVVANDGVALQVAPGSIHGLLGENGAGKSTLVGAIAGAVRPDSGSVTIDGRVLPPGDPEAALAAGIGMLHQEPLVLRRMTVLENLVIGRAGAHHRGLRVDRAAARADLAARCERHGFDLDPSARVESLTIGEHQQLEIVRLLATGVRVLILDEPTSAISADQRERLIATLRDLATDGLSVVLVSHKLDEVQQLCDEVTVLRHGRVAGYARPPYVTDDLVHMMFAAAPPTVAAAPGSVGAPLLVARGVVAVEGPLVTAPLDLTVNRGEIVGLAGLEGSGQRGILRAAAGLASPRSGTVHVDGRDVTTTPPHARPSGLVAYLPADRGHDGLVPGLTITEHVLLATSVGGRVDRAAARERAVEVIANARVKGTPESTPESLSGGNQQRLMLGLLPDAVDLLLLEHPTRGLDLHSAAWVWQRLRARRDAGAGIGFVSSDLEELLTYSDRIAVFFGGRIIAEVTPGETSVERLGRLIGGNLEGEAGRG